MSELSKAEIKRLRESEFFKFNNQSDFVQIRECKQIAKDLYEALRYFDSRSSRFAPLFSSALDRKYKMKQSRIRPQDYYTFTFFSVTISMFYSTKTHKYFVSVQGWKPITVPPSEITSLWRFGTSSLFSETREVFLKIVAEFIDTFINHRSSINGLF